MKKYDIQKIKTQFDKNISKNINHNEDNNEDNNNDDPIVDKKSNFNVRYYLKKLFDYLLYKKFNNAEKSKKYVKKFITKNMKDMKEIKDEIAYIKQSHNYKKDDEFNKEMNNFLETGKVITSLKKLYTLDHVSIINFLRNFLKHRLPLYELDDLGNPIEKMENIKKHKDFSDKKQIIHYDMLNNKAITNYKKKTLNNYLTHSYMTYDVFEFYYKKMIWLPFHKNITSVFFEFLTDNILDYFIDMEWAYSKKENKNNTTMYKANYMFFKDCSTFKNKRYDDNLKGIVFDFKKKTNIFFKMYIETDNNSIILYDNDMFLCEINYIKNVQTKLNSFDLETFKKNICNKNSLKIMQNILQDYFKNYNANEILFFLETCFKEKTNEYMIESISDILKINKKISSLLNTSAYFNKIDNKKYILENMLYLTTEEKLFEFFYDENISSDIKTLMLKKIDNNKEIIKIEIYNIFSNYLDPFSVFEKKKSFNKIGTPNKEDVAFSNVKLIDWKHLCVNKDDLLEYENYELTFFKEPNNTNIYCFKISELLKEFEQGNYINKYTNSQFPLDFVKKIQNTYNNDFIDNIYNQDDEASFVNEFLDNLKLNQTQEDFLNFFKDEINILLSDLVEKSVCFKCKKQILKDNINTIINDKMEKFCSIKCLENTNDV